MGQIEGFWHAPLITTAKGAPDPETDIPPALFTVKVVLPTGKFDLHVSIMILF